jgi:hypothetical protein
VLSGAVSFVYGLKSAEARNRTTEEEQGFRLEPVILYGRRRADPGVLVSWRF